MIGSQRQILRDTRAGVEVTRLDTVGGPRLRIRDLSEGAEICLDPFELVGLTRTRDSAHGLRPGVVASSVDPRPEPCGPADILRNEFAMVRVELVDLEPDVRLRIQDLGSGAEVTISAQSLPRLAHLEHHELAALLDPSDFVAAAEPDPDQV